MKQDEKYQVGEYIIFNLYYIEAWKRRYDVYIYGEIIGSKSGGSNYKINVYSCVENNMLIFFVGDETIERLATPEEIEKFKLVSIKEKYKI